MTNIYIEMKKEKLDRAKIEKAEKELAHILEKSDDDMTLQDYTELGEKLHELSKDRPLYEQAARSFVACGGLLQNVSTELMGRKGWGPDHEACCLFVIAQIEKYMKLNIVGREKNDQVREVRKSSCSYPKGQFPRHRHEHPVVSIVL